MTRSVAVALICVFTASSIAFAQDRRIASPPGASATEVGGRYNERDVYVGGKWIEVRYGRPIKRGRDLFGPDDFAEILNDGAPVWRAGANESTRLITEVPLRVGNTRIAPGEYTMFIELARNTWTLIVSTWLAQIGTYDTQNKNALYGAYDYTPDKDVVRVAMDLETLSHSFDQLSWEFLDITPAGGRLALLWDTKLASVPFQIEK